MFREFFKIFLWYVVCTPFFFISDSDESDGEGGLGNVNRVIMRPPGHSGKAKKGHLCFDASFETGNLGRVDLISEYEYDLFIRPDTCNPRFRFWFNFTVDNVKQDQRVVFNIVNISKSRNLFNENMTPLVKSSTRNKWQRIPKEHVFYHKSHLHHDHYVLSFCFGFDKEDEIFQFALAPPYSYSKLQTCLSLLESKASYLSEFFKRESIGKSIQNRRLDLITIGGLDRTQTRCKRRVVVIISRVHPGESPASFVCQGLLELLISSNAMASTLRDHVIFKVIPMLNPDGVFLGNYRSNLVGLDLNRSWHIATSWSHPTLMAVLEMLSFIDRSKEFQLDFVIDIHAHSTLKGCFIYGNTYEDVYRYERHILFPKLLAGNAFDYVGANSMFNSDNSKVGTARRHFCSILSSKVNCFSFEVSLFGYQIKEFESIIPYTEDSYKACGRNLIKTFLDYYQSIGAIPIQPSTELKVKKRRRKLRRRPMTSRSATNRTQAPLHLQDLTINYDSGDSLVNCSSYRALQSPKRHYHKISEHYNTKKTGGGLYNRINETSPTTFVILPEPSLSIIDFNFLTREEIERAKKSTAKNKQG